MLCFLEDDKGLIWLGTKAGLFQLNPKTEQLKFDKTISKAAYIRRLLQDTKNRIWVASSEGLEIIEGDKTTFFEQSNSQLLSNNIVDVEEDENDGIRPLNKYTYSVKALTPLEDFNTFFETMFDVEEADTIGGIVLKAFGHMPEKDEKVSIDGIKFKVTNSDKRRLLQLKVTLPESEE